MWREPIQIKFGVEGEKIFVIATHGNIKEELKPNLDQVFDNIQVELVFVKLVVSIVEPTQLVVVATKSS
jgi:glutamate racemase